MRWLFPTTLMLLLCGTPALAQQSHDPDGAVGRGLVCDSSRQLERFVEFLNQGKQEDDALQAVNDEAQNPMACGVFLAAFALGKPVINATMLGEAVRIVEITVIAVNDGAEWRSVQPTTQYTLLSEPGQEL